MPLLQVRDFPADLYQQLKELAESERRSIAQQTVVLIRDALVESESSQVRHTQAVDEARRLAESTPVSALDPAALIREDRERCRKPAG